MKNLKPNLPRGFSSGTPREGLAQAPQRLYQPRLPPPYPVLDALLLLLDVRLIRRELLALSLVEPPHRRRLLRPSSMFDLRGRRREWGTLSLADAGLRRVENPRDGSLLLLAAKGRKGRFALWMNPLLCAVRPVRACPNERAALPRDTE